MSTPLPSAPVSAPEAEVHTPGKLPSFPHCVHCSHIDLLSVPWKTIHILLSFRKPLTLILITYISPAHCTGLSCSVHFSGRTLLTQESGKSPLLCARNSPLFPQSQPSLSTQPWHCLAELFSSLHDVLSEGRDCVSYLSCIPRAQLITCHIVSPQNIYEVNGRSE